MNLYVRCYTIANQGASLLPGRIWPINFFDKFHSELSRKEILHKCIRTVLQYGGMCIFVLNGLRRTVRDDVQQEIFGWNSRDRFSSRRKREIIHNSLVSFVPKHGLHGIIDYREVLKQPCFLSPPDREDFIGFYWENSTWASTILLNLE